jgi:hypothetical protein
VHSKLFGIVLDNLDKGLSDTEGGDKLFLHLMIINTFSVTSVVKF